MIIKTACKMAKNTARQRTAISPIMRFALNKFEKNTFMKKTIVLAEINAKVI
jgi:hypothetical protein